VELIVSSGCAYVLGLEDQFKVAAEAGFDGFEYLVNREHVPETTAKLIELSRHYEIPIRNVHAPFQPVPGWDGPVTSLLSTVNVARAIEARSVTFHPPERAVDGVTFNRWMVGIDDFQKTVGGGDVMITVENMPRSKSWRGIKVPFATAPYRYQERDELWELLEEQNLFMTFDTTHFGTAGENLVAAYAQFRDRVRTIHLSNFSKKEFQEHLPFDQGDLDLADFIDRALGMGFSGLLTLEVFPEFLQTHEGGITGALKDFVRWVEGVTGLTRERRGGQAQG